MSRPRKRIVAFAITAAIAGGALWYSIRQRSKTPAEPESAVWQMLDESRAGKVEGYLSCFTGSMRAELEATAKGMGVEKFSEYLKGSVARVKGVAIYDVRATGPEDASLTVEYVYQEQNERQRMSLRHEGAAWRIAAAEKSQRIQPLIPYGKPVSEVP